MGAWFEDETFWTELYPFLFPAEKFEAARREVDLILELVRFKGNAILDVACGPGRHAVELARRGFQVTGVDLSPFLLGKARERARGSGQAVEWLRADMREFVRPESFDLALNLYTSIGYFEDEADDRRVLQNLHRSLRANGACVLELAGKESLARAYQPAHCRRIGPDALLVELHEIQEDWTRIRNEWILIRGESARTFRFHHTLYSGRELRDRLEAAGFGRVRLFGDLGGGPYGLKADRLVAVAWK